MPLAAIRSILLSDAADDFHAAGRITVTRLLTCPREIAITDNCALTAVDIRKRDTARKGTVIHADLQRHLASGYGEVEFPLPGQPAPQIFGEPVSGRVDVVAADFSSIEDYKAHSESSQRYKKRTADPNNDDAQLNIIRILLARGILNVEPETYRPRMTAWHTAQTSKRGPPPWVPVECLYMSEDDIAAYCPIGGEYTVQQILAAYRLFRTDRAAGMELDDALRRMPLAGRQMLKGTKCSDYCAARKYCDTLEGLSDEQWGF